MEDGKRDEKFIAQQIRTLKWHNSEGRVNKLMYIYRTRVREKREGNKRAVGLVFGAKQYK